MLIYLLSFFSYQCSANATSTSGIYLKVHKPVSMKPVNVTVVKVQTRIQCSQKCLSQSCLCFSYDDSLQECGIGNCLSPNTNTSKAQEFFVSCNFNEGFQLFTSGSFTACIRMTTTEADYATARNDCIARSAQLYTMTTTEKLNILQDYLPSNEYFWIGLNDLEEEDTFRWEGDNTICDSTCRKEIFWENEPNNQDGAEDCVLYINKWLNDGSCNTPNTSYLCEKNFN